MNEINFKSTYKIPINQKGINNTKKIELKSLINSYKKEILTQSEEFTVITIPDKNDKSFVRKLKKLGCNFLKIITPEKTEKTEIIKKEKSLFETPFEELFKNRETDIEKINLIKNSANYKRIEKKYGKDAAEAIFFFSREK